MLPLGPEDVYDAIEAVSYERVEPTPKELPLSNDALLPWALVPDSDSIENVECLCERGGGGGGSGDGMK